MSFNVWQLFKIIILKKLITANIIFLRMQKCFIKFFYKLLKTFRVPKYYLHNNNCKIKLLKKLTVYILLCIINVDNFEIMFEFKLIKETYRIEPYSQFYNKVYIYK